MDGNNSFLSSYKKKMDSEKVEPEKEAAVSNEEQPKFRYEEKSGFVKPRQRSRDDLPPSQKKPSPLIAILVGSVVIVAAVIGLIWYLNRGIEVIDFTNWTANDANLWASEKKVNLQVEEQYNDKVDAGKIISQNPVKGTTVSKGAFIKVALSIGHDLTVSLKLPDLMNMTKEEIDAWSAENFMTTVRITTEFSTEVAAGKVISFKINDNTVVDEVKRNTPIYIIVSKGREDETAVMVTLPNFKEKSISECYDFANENGLVLTVKEQYDNFAPKGAIIAQSVKADEKVRKGDEIVLTLSKGKMITIPSFAAYSKQKANAVATELGIPVTIIEKYSTLATGKFISQSIAEGSVYAEGDILELNYSLGNKVALTSFVGQTRDAIESWAKELNDQGASISLSVTYTKSNSPKGKIIYQDKANTMISVKTTIKITVSLGKVVFVPDFVAPAGSGYDVAITREKALAMCEQLNIIPVFVASSKAGRLPGEIWYQSIAAGTEVSEESTITLKYNPATAKVTVPDFENKTQDEIIAAGWYQKFSITFVLADTYVEGHADKAYKQSIPAGSSVAVGSDITIYISPPPPEPSPT